MPEGPEVRREAMALARILVDEPLVRVEYRVPRLAPRARMLENAQVKSVTSHGKAMLIAWSNGLTHYSHNQLYGKWRVVTAPRLPRLLERHERSIRVVLSTADDAAALLSATQIELLTARELAKQPYLASLGPDVLERSTTVAIVERRLRDPAFARRQLGALLLDQRFLAGLGNYLRSDILHASGLRHQMRPQDLSDQARKRLARAAVELPRLSLKTGGITQDPSLTRVLTRQGIARGDLRFRVYGRSEKPCWICATPIRRVNAGGRGIYYCPKCQSDEGLRRRT
ncbi:MAG TPA: endonuclease VIII [Casimicrobiaceae bacterium]|nr:endonuclease VIII [Casimicrobiaceae bacterium]